MEHVVDNEDANEYTADYLYTAWLREDTLSPPHVYIHFSVLHKYTVLYTAAALNIQLGIEQVRHEESPQRQEGAEVPPRCRVAFVAFVVVVCVVTVVGGCCIPDYCDALYLKVH